MRIVQVEKIQQAAYQLCVTASMQLAPGVADKLQQALASETLERASYILQVLLDNSQLAKQKSLPLCQDTGQAVFFVELGNQVSINGDLYAAIDAGVAKAADEGYLRASVVTNPLFNRVNTGNNTPAVVHLQLVKGQKVGLHLMLKGCGAENKSTLTMLEVAAGLAAVKDFVLTTVKTAGAAACPPLFVGVGVGGNLEQCALLAKKALLRAAVAKAEDQQIALLEQQWQDDLNSLGLGPQGMGGQTTCLGLAIETAPCHMAGLPVAVNLQCHAHRAAKTLL